MREIVADDKIRRDTAVHQDEDMSTYGHGDDALSTRLGRFARQYRAFRKRIGRRRWVGLAFRIGVGLLGTVVLVGGILLIPYPGPGWLVVFAGLAILATEFAWAGRVLAFARARYDAWNAWLRRQNVWIRLATLLATGLIVLVILWLLGVFSLVGGWFGAHWDWLRSPLGIFS